MADNGRAVFFVGLLVIAIAVGYALDRMAAEVGITEVVHSALSPLPLPSASSQFGSFRLITFPPVSLPPDLTP